MLRAVPSIRLKMMLIVFATSLSALLFAGIVLVAYDVRTHQASWAQDLQLQAAIIGRTSAPAIVFGDTLTAHQSLATLSIRPEVLDAAVYTREGALFATYSMEAGSARRFPLPRFVDAYWFVGDRLMLFRPIDDADGRVGTVYLSAHYDRVARLANYLPVLALILIGSLSVAIFMSYVLQSAVTRPLLAMAQAAHEVRVRRDFSLRVRKETQDETGQLVDAFNAMLAEVAEAQRSLLESNRRKDEFLATLAHELRNPLGPIRNAARYLRMQGAGQGSNPSLELIDRQVQHMVRLIEDLLDISRITRDTLELRPSDFVVSDLVRDVVDATQYDMGEAGLQLDLNVPEGEIHVHADRARLVQVISNLVNNAIKYTPRGGRIGLAVAAQRRDLVITVVDTGIGIPAEHLDDIFEPFSQVDRSLEKTRGGLGIGLALAQRLAALHGGTIEASSEGLGKGSSFCVTLPIVSDAPARVPVAPAAETAVGQGMKVLVADDNVDGARSLAMLLGAMGHRVVVAYDGVQAFEQLAAAPFDAAVLDVGMPRLNGYDLARRIREQPWGRSLLLIALTGWGKSEDKQRAYEAGFDHHLTKPVEPELLLGALAPAKPARS